MPEEDRARHDGIRMALRALRPADWWYFVPLPWAAVTDGRRADRTVLVEAAIASAAAAGCLAFAYGLNGITDRALDRDATKNAFVGAGRPPRVAFLVLALAAATAVGSAALLGGRALLSALASLVAGTLYSAGPRLKRWPLVGTTANLFIFAPLPLLAADRPLSLDVVRVIALFAVLLTQNQLLHEIADADDDRGGGVRTTAIALGARGRRLVSAVLGPAAAALLVAGSPTLDAVAVGGGSALLAGAAMLFASSETNARNLRVWHRWSSLVVGAMLFASISVDALA